MRAYINIYKNTLIDNYNLIKKVIDNKKLFIVLKANAYGYGISEIAKLFSNLNSPSFVVATIEEAMMIRKALVFNQILLLENTNEYKLAMNLKLNLAIHSLEKLNELASKHLNLPIHLNINTGLNRDGIEINEVDKAIEIIKKGHLNLKGIYTHHSDPTNIEKENKLFKEQLIKFYSFKKLIVHTGSSSALDYSDDFTNAIRVGGSLYGLYKNKIITTEPAIELLAPIWSVKKVHKDENIGYGTTSLVPDDGYIYLLPIGYKDGFMRSRNTIGYLAGNILIKVGNTMMDHTIMFSKKEFKVGQIVELIGKNLTVEDMSKAYDVIPYELCCSLNERIKRNYL